MADYLTLFSFLIPIDTTDAGWVDELWPSLDACGDGHAPDRRPIFDPGDEVFGLPLVEATSDGLWFHDDGGQSDIATTICVAQWVLTHPGTPTVIEFAWSDSCSRPLLDAYGGGAAKVNRHSYATLHTSSTTVDEFLTGDLDDQPEHDDTAPIHPSSDQEMGGDG
ncbi:MAG TPA: hypothetical protein VNQ73_02605 [Ilumatobacter sp.]|nr:hypothetical protein [Ilumatobacter sp.]